MKPHISSGEPSLLVMGASWPMSMYVVEADELHLFESSLDLKEKSEGEIWI
jgi:hypothetical protein